MGVPNPETDGQFYAGVPLRRLFAFVIDIVVIMVLFVVTVFIGALLTVATAGIAGPVIFLLLMACGFLYRWIMLWKRSAGSWARAI